MHGKNEILGKSRQYICTQVLIVGIGFKQGDALSPILYNLALEKAVSNEAKQRKWESDQWLPSTDSKFFLSMVKIFAFIPVLKSGDKADVKNYRLISILVTYINLLNYYNWGVSNKSIYLILIDE